MRCYTLVGLLFIAACGGTDVLSTLPAGTVILQTKPGTTATFTFIRQGTFIAFRSADGQHHSMASTATPAYFPEVDVPAGGTSTELKLTVPGEHGYFCSIHGQAAENGSVRVAVPGS